jgi:hypothetical protein
MEEMYALNFMIFAWAALSHAVTKAPVTVSSSSWR